MFDQRHYVGIRRAPHRHAEHQDNTRHDKSLANIISSAPHFRSSVYSDGAVDSTPYSMIVLLFIHYRLQNTRVYAGAHQTDRCQPQSILPSNIAPSFPMGLFYDKKPT
jgi:hypothetical protein